MSDTKDRHIEMTDLECQTLSQYQKPVDRFESALKSAEIARATFIAHILESHGTKLEPGEGWAIDWDQKRIALRKMAPAGAPASVRMQKTG